jgi:hypothetical protein
MANIRAIANGNWSNNAIWSPTPPTTVDDVYSNNFTVYVDNSFLVTSVRNTTAVGITGGGFFVLNNGVSLSANVEGGGANQVAAVQFLSAAPATATLVGNLSAVSFTLSGPRAFLHNGTGTANIYGDGLGRIKGSGNPSDGYIQNNSLGTLNLFGNYGAGTNVLQVDNIGIWNNSTGTINIVGNLSGGTGGQGAYNNSLGTISVTGNVFGGIGGTGGTVTGITNVNLGTVNVMGNVFSTANGGAGATNNSFGILNITGDVFSRGTAVGAVNNSVGVMTIVGNVSGGSGTNGFGASNTSFGILNVVGNVVGGVGTSSHGVHNSSGGSVSISGIAIGGIGATAYGLNNAATGYAYTRAVSGNAFGLNNSTGININAGAANSQNGSLYVEEFYFGIRGATPIVGPVYIVPKSNNTLVGVVTALGSSISFYNSLSVNNLVPPTSSVRSGVIYDVGNKTGTMTVPSLSSVSLGVLVDNTSGIAALTPNTIWDYSRLSATDVNSIGGRLREAITTQALGQQIASFNL